MVSKKIKRTFILGSEWLYLKIYASYKICDNLVIDAIYSLSLKLEKKGMILRWFFVRYSDPYPHIRLRFYLRYLDNCYVVIAEINRALYKYIRNGLVYRIVYDTYIREIERYGSKVMELTESLFCENSKIVCMILKSINSEADDYRWISAIMLIDSFLSKVGLEVKDKLQIIGEMYDSFRTEFGFNEHNSKQLNDMYRHRKRIISDILNESLENPVICKINHIIKSNLLLEYDRRTKINIQAYLHMMMNRLFVMRNREYELLIYGFLHKYYMTEHFLINNKVE